MPPFVQALAALLCVVAVDTASAQPADRVGAARSAHSVQAVASAATLGLARLPTGSDAAQLVEWIAHVQDHQGRPFFVVDKANATLYVFDRHARLQALSPVLLGAAVGDDSVPGIGNRPMDQILPSERTTPAGRFVAEVGKNASGEDVVWVDHAAAVSMHRLRSGTALERRAQRMVSPTVADNRISYGCINVPVPFYNRHVQAAFSGSTTATVYVLPETRSLWLQFGLPPPWASVSRR